MLSPDWIQAIVGSRLSCPNKYYSTLRKFSVYIECGKGPVRFVDTDTGGLFILQSDYHNRYAIITYKGDEAA